LRNENANKIRAALREFDFIRVPKHCFEDCVLACEPSQKCVHAAYKCYAFVDNSKLNSQWDRDRIMNAISARGVPCFSGSCSEVYLEKAFDNTSFRPVKRLPNAKLLGETSLMFLVHPTLTQDEIEMTCRVISEVLTDVKAL
jgi:dTDP-4-amino-4,6-dideoxygalactose transaminase